MYGSLGDWYDPIIDVLEGRTPIRVEHTVDPELTQQAEAVASETIWIVGGIALLAVLFLSSRRR
jgi:hypothetical protein